MTFMPGLFPELAAKYKKETKKDFPCSGGLASDPR